MPPRYKSQRRGPRLGLPSCFLGRAWILAPVPAGAGTRVRGIARSGSRSRKSRTTHPFASNLIKERIDRPPSLAGFRREPSRRLTDWQRCDLSGSRGRPDAIEKLRLACVNPCTGLYTASPSRELMLRRTAYGRPSRACRGMAAIDLMEHGPGGRRDAEDTGRGSGDGRVRIGTRRTPSPLGSTAGRGNPTARLRRLRHVPPGGASRSPGLPRRPLTSTPVACRPSRMRPSSAWIAIAPLRTSSSRMKPGSRR